MATTAIEEQRHLAGDDAPGNPWRRNLYVLWVAETLTILGFCLSYPFLPFYLAELGARSFDSQALWAGAMSAASAGFMALTAPFWGMAADCYGRKPMLVRAMVCGALTTGLMGLVVAPWQLLALFILDGALSGTVSAAMTLVATNTPRARLGYALGLLQTAVLTGASVGPLIGGLLADRIGYRPIFALGSLLLFIAAGLALALVRETFTPVLRGSAATGETPRGATLRVILLVGALPAAVGMMFAVRLALAAVQPILPLFVETLAGADAHVSTLTGLTFGASGIAGTAASLTLGRAADRLGHRLVLITTGLAMAGLFVPLTLVREPWQLIVCYGLLGFAAAGIVPSAQAVIADLSPPERHGAVFGVTSAAVSAGGFVGPFVGSLLAANADLRLAFLVSGAVVLVCTAWLAHALQTQWHASPAAATSSDPGSG